ncbi:hypothetical protein JL722_10253 [Aureococcus anophagefferens]|nr:hypothetical protein JL722_10253 [Aureococcus anophagefferens]
MSDDTGGAPPDDAPAPAPAPAPPAPPEDEQSAPAYRVKVYRLNEDGQWDDCGTGSVTLAKGSAPTILVLSENNDRGARGALLASRLIPSQDAYTKQGENIITWDTRRGDGGSAWHALPAPSSAAALDEWACTLARAAESPAARERYAATLLAEDCLLLRQLAASFDDAEDGDDVEVLVKLADVVKLVVLLNEPPLVEALLDDPLFEPVLGALEYAADLKKQHAALAVDDGAAPRERRSWVEPDEAARGAPRPRPAAASPPAGAADADAEVAAATAAAPDDDDEAANRRASVESGNSAATTEAP